MYNWRSHICHTLLLFLYIGLSVTYAQSPDTNLTKREQRQQKRELRKTQKEQLYPDATVRTGDTLKTKKQLREERRSIKHQKKEQLAFKADSIKIAAMLLLRSGAYSKHEQRGSTTKEKLQLRNATEEDKKDSLKKVMRDAKKVAGINIEEQEARDARDASVRAGTQAYQEEIAPYLDHYKEYKEKIALLDSTSSDALINEVEDIALNELDYKGEEIEDLAAYTKTVTQFNANSLDSANRDETLNQLKDIGVDELKKQDQYKEVAETLDPLTDQFNEFKGQGNPVDSANREQTLNTLKEIGITELERQDQYKEIKAELTPYIDSPYLKGLSLQDLDSMSLDSLKSLGRSTFAQLEKELEKELLKREEFKELNTGIEEFDKLKGLPESYRKQYERYMNGEGLERDAMLEAAKKASKLLSEHSKEIQSAQTQLTKLKKKYSSVQSSNDLSTATKRNSLQGEPLGKRIVLGLGLQIISFEPLNIDFNPVLGYRIDKKFMIAVGGTYRARFTEMPPNSPRQGGGQAARYGADDLTYGWRVFADYNVWKFISIHGEFERMSREFEVTGTDWYARDWVNGGLLGLSSTYDVKGAVTGNFQVLYNFLYEFDRAVYQSPWVFRFGFDIKGL